MAYEVLEPEAALPGYEVIEPEQAEASRVKNDYLARGGNPRDVLSPERQKVFDDTLRRRKAEGATDEEAALAASDAVDKMGVQQRPDGTIAAGFKPTEQAKADGIIEEKALPAVEAAQAKGVTTVASNTTQQGGGVAIGSNPQGQTVKVETDAKGNELPGYDVIEEDQPSRLGAITRTVASEFIPSSIGAVAARAGSLVPGPLPLKIGTGDYRDWCRWLPWRTRTSTTSWPACPWSRTDAADQRSVTERSGGFSWHNAGRIHFNSHRWRGCRSWI